MMSHQERDAAATPRAVRAVGSTVRPWANAVTVLTILGLLAALAMPLVASRFRSRGETPARQAPNP